MMKFSHDPSVGKSKGYQQVKYPACMAESNEYVKLRRHHMRAASISTWSATNPARLRSIDGSSIYSYSSFITKIIP